MASVIFKKAPSRTANSRYTATFSPTGAGLKPVTRHLSAAEVSKPKPGKPGVYPMGTDNRRS